MILFTAALISFFILFLFHPFNPFCVTNDVSTCFLTPYFPTEGSQTQPDHRLEPNSPSKAFLVSGPVSLTNLAISRNSGMAASPMHS